MSKRKLLKRLQQRLQEVELEKQKCMGDTPHNAREYGKLICESTILVHRIGLVERGMKFLSKDWDI